MPQLPNTAPASLQYLGGPDLLVAVQRQPHPAVARYTIGDAPGTLHDDFSKLHRNDGISFPAIDNLPAYRIRIDPAVLRAQTIQFAAAVQKISNRMLHPVSPPIVDTD